MAKYKITTKIGAGAFGNVYCLAWTGHQRSEKFALKTVNILRLNRDERECSNEGTLMLKLSHAHLVHCYDAFICSPHLYLIMELCRHGSLEQLLKERSLLVPEEQILSWMAQLADVLRYLHALKVIHRDLKPANIFLDEKESVKLGDLGVARELDHTVQERHTTAGTLPYMSPEAFTGLPYNYKTDVWSLGCCIHEAMTLEKTFHGQSWAELHQMITFAKVPKMPSLYQGKLQSLVLSLLDADSCRRPDALEILLVLFQIQGKRFSSESSPHTDTTPFDHRQICQTVQSYEISSGSDVIHPLRADNSFDDYQNNRKSSKDSRSSNLSFPGDDIDLDDADSYKAAKDYRVGEEECNVSEFQDKKSVKSPRPLPLPKSKKKKKILKSLKDQRRVKELEPKAKDADSTQGVTDDQAAYDPRLSPHPVPGPVHESPQSSYRSEDDSGNSPQKQSSAWLDDYMETLTRDSIQWLRSRFKPKPTDSQLSTSDCADKSDGDSADNIDEGDTNYDNNINDDDDDDEEEEVEEETEVEEKETEVEEEEDVTSDSDDEEDVTSDSDDEEDVTSGLVTIFTQSQTAVYINNKSTPRVYTGAEDRQTP